MANRIRIVFVVVLSLCEVLLFGGLQNGWFSILFTIKQDRVFADLCSTKNNSSGNESYYISGDNCFEQDEKLNLIFTIGMTLFSFSTIVTGQLYFKFNARNVRIFSMCEMVAGLLCFGLTSPDNPWLPLPGIILVGMSGMSLLISNMKVASLLPRGSSVYIGLINGCLDSSVLTVMAIKAMYEKGVKRLHSYIGVAVLVIVISGICTILRNKINQSEDRPSETDLVEDTSIASDGENAKMKLQETTETSVPENQDCLYSRWTIIRSQLFIFHILWMGIVLLRFNYFVGSINRSFEQLFGSNSAEVSYFTDVMTYTMLGGVMSSFTAGYVMEMQKKWFEGPMEATVPLTVTSLLAVLLTSLTFVPTRSTLYLSFIVLTMFRSFTFCTNMGFVISTYPEKYVSFLVGFVFSISGLISLTQYALFMWSLKYEDATLHVNTVLLCLSVLTLLHPFFIYLGNKRKAYVCSK